MQHHLLAVTILFFTSGMFSAAKDAKSDDTTKAVLKVPTAQEMESMGKALSWDLGYTGSYAPLRPDQDGFVAVDLPLYYSRFDMSEERKFKYLFGNNPSLKYFPGHKDTPPTEPESTQKDVTSTTALDKAVATKALASLTKGKNS